jgi:hypothetical protein
MDFLTGILNKIFVYNIPMIFSTKGNMYKYMIDDLCQNSTENIYSTWEL